MSGNWCGELWQNGRFSDLPDSVGCHPISKSTISGSTDPATGFSGFMLGVSRPSSTAVLSQAQHDQTEVQSRWLQVGSYRNQLHLCW